MKIHVKSRGIPAVLLALIIVLCAAVYFARPNESRGTVTIWYLEDDVLAAGLESAAESYNSSLFLRSLPVTLKSFPDEDALAAAFESAAPELLLCSHYRAFDLESRGKLRDLSAALDGAPDYPKGVLSRGGGVGKSYFPVGCDVPVLLVNKTLFPDASFKNLEALCEAALKYTASCGKPCFSVESFSALFYTCLLREGEEFDAQDEKSENYIKLYNLLAGCVYSGALSLSGDPAGGVYGGELAFAAVMSSSLKDASDDFAVLSLPSLGDTDSKDSFGVAYGLAAVAGSGGSGDDAAAFIKWLFSGSRDIKLALGGSLVPSRQGSSAALDARTNGLLEQEGGIVSLPALDSAFEENRADFEESFRARMALLN